MKTFQALLFALAFMLSGCTESTSPQAEQTQPEAMEKPTETPIVERSSGEKSIIDSTKEMGRETWDKTKEISSQAVDKSKEIYQSAKETGSKIGSTVVEKSKSAWGKTKEISADAMEKAGEVGESL
ncbi:hypothetical protein [Candidatus Vondammii sp. HM_W22]|uniref:hypothetical protein n=1 Tax=Candidatus Vondammii sp. HM_W22 TaxID=2687299 RepID=UPI001F1316A2|nr:hypothetical protein [Candidatus Vondammii sp. HM_W22]